MQRGHCGAAAAASSVRRRDLPDTWGWVGLGWVGLGPVIESAMGDGGSELDEGIEF